MPYDKYHPLDGPLAPPPPDTLDSECLLDGLLCRLTGDTLDAKLAHVEPLSHLGHYLFALLAVEAQRLRPLAIRFTPLRLPLRARPSYGEPADDDDDYARRWQRHKRERAA